MKKIIYIHQYFKFPDARGGTRSYDLSTSFLKRGYSVSVLTSSNIKKSNKRWFVYQREGIEVHEIYLPYSNSLSKFKRIKSFYLFIFFTTIRLLKLKTDIVLATSTPLTIGIPAMINKWLTKTPYIFEVRDVWPEAVIAIGAIRNRFVQYLLFKLEFLIYKYSSQIVPLSIDMQKSIQNRFPEFIHKSDIVIENISEINRFQSTVNGVDLYEKLGIQPRFTVLYAGTFGKVNGIDIVIKWAELIYDLDSTICFVLFGEGAEKNNCIDLAKSKGLLNKNIFILDSITKNELPKWYKSVSMGSSFVIDIEELWANSANKFFDTLAAGKPILINHEGWQAECIKNNKIGFVLSPTPNLHNALEFVKFTQENDFTELGNNALKTAKLNYSLDIACQKYLIILDRISSNNK